MDKKTEASVCACPHSELRAEHRIIPGPAQSPNPPHPAARPGHSGEAPETSERGVCAPCLGTPTHSGYLLPRPLLLSISLDNLALLSTAPEARRPRPRRAELLGARGLRSGRQLGTRSFRHPENHGHELLHTGTWMPRPCRASVAQMVNGRGTESGRRQRARGRPNY